MLFNYISSLVLHILDINTLKFAKEKYTKIFQEKTDLKNFNFLIKKEKNYFIKTIYLKN